MIIIECVKEYTHETASDLGKLRPYLSSGASDEPVEETYLRSIIDSLTGEIFVARIKESGQIIGTATVSLTPRALMGNKAWLEDFVTHPESGIKGVGQLLWNEIGIWCKENNVDLEFTSRPSRERAHHFYLKQGAQIRQTTVFKKHF